jgi:hypothetical protein
MLKISKGNAKPKIKNGNNKKEKYVLNIEEDLLKIPNDTFYKIDISSLSGEDYNKIYQEALEVEQGKRKLKNIKPITVDIEGKDNVDKFFESKTKGTKGKKDKKIMSERKSSMTTRSRIKENLDIKIKNDKKEKEKDEKKDDSFQTPTKGKKYTKIIKLNKKLKYDSPVSNKSKAIVYTNENYVTPVKNRTSLLFDSYGRMRERNNDNDSTNYSTPDKNKSISLRNKIELMRKREDKPRISSEGRNTEIKSHRNEPLEIIFEENSRIKKVISPEINKKRNSSSKFSRILNNLYNINSSINNDFNHNQNININKEVKTEDKNNKYEKSISSIFNEIKKKLRKKYYFSLLQKKVNYLRQIKSNSKFNQITNYIQTNNNFNTNNENKNEINTNNTYDNNSNNNNTCNSNNSNNNFSDNSNNNHNNKTYDNSRKKHHKPKGFRNNNNDHKINKIKFEFKYNSNYGDNIGILGSTDQLGNWCQDKILFLKWNYGNIWSNSIDVDNYNLENFEFKFIISHDGTIYWEKGYNYLVDFEALIDEIKYYKKGRFNKYEYIYKKDSSELILKCKRNGWEWDINNNSDKSLK